MTELSRDAPLFDKILVMRLQSGLQEARQVPLTLRIIPGIRPTNISGQNEKLFHFEVSQMSLFGLDLRLKLGLGFWVGFSIAIVRLGQG
jgi:hypothetical protein